MEAVWSSLSIMMLAGASTGPRVYETVKVRTAAQQRKVRSPCVLGALKNPRRGMILGEGVHVPPVRG